MFSPAHEIVPGLWLGNKDAASDGEWLRDHKITVVFNCTKDLPFHPDIERKYRVPVHDNLKQDEIQNMAVWSTEIMYKLVAEYNRGNTILVHCYAGMQRSAAIVAMFLIITRNMTTEQAMVYIKSKRTIAFFPAANFEDSIRYCENMFRSYTHYM
jgi:dual specificity phosphatase 12